MTRRAQGCTHRIESLCSSAYVVQTRVVKQDFLHDEGGHRPGELGPDLHDAQTEGDDLGLQQEVHHLGVVHLSNIDNI